MSKVQLLRKTQCLTCPFRKGSPHADLQPLLVESALISASRLCHSTGTNALYGRTGKKLALCRGARDMQLRMFAGWGFISAPTDEAWADRCRQMGLPEPKLWEGKL